MKCKITLNHVAVHVGDLKRSVDFYREVVGLKEIEEPFKDGIHAWFEIGTGISLHLIQDPDAPTEFSKTNHLCFSVDEMESFIQNLDQHGVSYENWPGQKGVINVRPDGILQIFFRDPDGYWLEVNNEYF